ncbi:MAG: AbrB/MazE/SpoVT family DNA-binding domain-containing protein [Methylocystis sp.]
MHTTSLRKVGGSVMLAVPPAILDLLNLRAGATVGVSVEHGRLIIEPAVKPRYTLDELLSQCDASAVPSVEDRAWLHDRPQGSELL